MFLLRNERRFKLNSIYQLLFFRRDIYSSANVKDWHCRIHLWIFWLAICEHWHRSNVSIEPVTITIEGYECRAKDIPNRNGWVQKSLSHAQQFHPFAIPTLCPTIFIYGINFLCRIWGRIHLSIVEWLQWKGHWRSYRSLKSAQTKFSRWFGFTIGFNANIMISWNIHQCNAPHYCVTYGTSARVWSGKEDANFGILFGNFPVYFPSSADRRT